MPAAKAARKRQSPLSKAEAAVLFARLAAARPDPRTELDYADAFTLLVAVVLSAQATDKSVNKATPALFAAAPTPEKMAALGAAKIGALIQTIGLWRNKAKHVEALSRALIARHGGQVPRDRDALEDLPGVGRKTANVVLAEAFGEATIAVDTHVFRVARRTGLSRRTTPEGVEFDLMKITPPEFLRGAHHWLILHGRYVCLARRPDCPNCAVRDICTFPEKTGEPYAPARKRPAKAKTKLAAAPSAKARKR